MYPNSNNQQPGTPPPAAPSAALPPAQGVQLHTPATPTPMGMESSTTPPVPGGNLSITGPMAQKTAPPPVSNPQTPLSPVAGGQITPPPPPPGVPMPNQQVNGAPQVPGQPQNPQQPPLPPIKPAKSNPNSTQNSLQVAEIRDGIVIMNDGSFRAVVLARSINFDLMSPQERESVEYSYQSFLNSLYFDIQILVRSRKVDMRPYLEKLNKIRSEQDNMLLALLMEDYIYYINQLVEQTNIMNKQFYLIVPYHPDVNAKQVMGETKSLFGGLFGSKKALTVDEETLIKAKTELQNRVQSIMNGLLQLGVQSVPLDTQELIELYYDVYNPDTATRQPLSSFSDLTSVVVRKGEGEAKRPNLDGGIF